ncbi:hypothetical protein OC844_005813 [Tilletia horrida]|nr:hypothetical protein OC844_005813 [Tilletia horrida]
MRLGQGFNSYTGQICVDDAVLVNPERAENVITNDGTTMRILAQKMNKASVWRQLKEYVNDGVLSTNNVDERNPGQPYKLNYEEGDTQTTQVGPIDKPVEPGQVAQLPVPEGSAPVGSDPAAAEAEPVAVSDDELRNKTLEEVREVGKQEAAADAEDKQKKTAKQEADLKAEIERLTKPVEVAPEMDKKTKAFQDAIASRPTGLGKKDGEPEKWSIQQSIGPSQTVIYTAQFIDKLSEVTNDLHASAALTIQKGKLGGSGSGTWIDTNKFYKSDIRFYISVKVINQSINYKDALEYNPIRSVDETNKEAFTECFGDSFISGFLEGGEFNAVICMSVHNSAMKKDLMAEAKVAFTTDTKLEIKGDGNIKLAKENLAANTDTYTMVRWCGGGSIKNYDDEWSIDTVLATANRFPYLVSMFPQRTYAILTKYENLRSFVAIKPVKISPLKYENATLHTNMLMDAYLELKSLSQEIAANMVAVQKGIKRFKVATATELGQPFEPSQALEDAKLTQKYPATQEGLDQARREIANQMNKIVAEVNAVTKDPSLATKDRGTIFIGPASLRTLIPEVEYKSRRTRNQAISGQALYPSVDDKNEASVAMATSTEAHLFDETKSPLALSESEQIKVADLERENNEIAERTRVTAPVGSLSTGTMFCTLDNNIPTAVITEISTGQMNGTLRALSVSYSNGVILEIGDDIDDYTEVVDPSFTGILPKTKPMTRRTLSGLGQSEVISSASIEIDGTDDELTLSVVGLSLVTNRGRILHALFQGVRSESHYKLHVFDKPIPDGFVSGFWGGAKNDEQAGGADIGGRITRLGLIWTRLAAKASLFDEEELIECQAANEPVQMAEAGEVKWRSLPDVPQLICGLLRYERKASCPGEIAFATNEVQPDGFKYKLTSKDTNNCQGGGTWIILPEIQDVDIQCGTVEVELDGVEISQSVTFDVPFTSGTPPDVICWLLSFSVAKNTDEVDIKVGANGETICSTYFDLIVTSSKGVIPLPSAVVAPPADKKDDEKKDTKTSSSGAASSSKPSAPAPASAAATSASAPPAATEAKDKVKVTTAKATIGWMAYYDSAAAGSGASFAAGTFRCTTGKQSLSEIEAPYPKAFRSRPTKHFAALSAIKAPYDAVSAWACGVKNGTTTAAKMKLEVSAPPSSEVSFAWVSSL